MKKSEAFIAGIEYGSLVSVAAVGAQLVWFGIQYRKEIKDFVKTKLTKKEGK